MPLQWLLSNIDFYLSCEEGGEAPSLPSPLLLVAFLLHFGLLFLGFTASSE